MSKFDSRAAVILGAVTSAAAYIATSFVSSIHLFLITFDFIAAVGASFMYMGNIIPIYEYFDKHKSKALAFAFSGFSIATFIWPPLVTVLINYYGWKGTFVIMAGFILQLCVCGALLRPFKEEKDNSDTIAIENKGVCSHLISQGTVFTNKYFLVFCIVCLLDSISNTYMLAYLPILAQGLGASDTQGALLLSIRGKYTLA